jgi:FixJ family two-component response regulator
LEARKDIRIVITDMDMPGSMDGLKLARAIRDRWPPIELILTSGHFDVPKSDIPERGLFFSKPYRDQEIVSALQNLLLNDANNPSGMLLLTQNGHASSSAECPLSGVKRT